MSQARLIATEGDVAGQGFDLEVEETMIGRNSALSPRAASARVTTSSFHLARKPSEACCSVQPPQRPKWGQGGETRSGAAERILSGGPGSITSPGKVKG